MKTLVSVMVHKDAQTTFDRHFPLWRNLENTEILVVCPTNSPIILPERGKCRRLEVGHAEHSGKQSIVRVRTVLEHLAGQGEFERYVFFEYDSFCLGQLPEPRADIMAPVFRDNGPNRGFKGTIYLHPPIMFTAAGLSKVCEQIKKMSLAEEGGVWDRWLGWAIEQANIPFIDMLTSGEAYSSNTIEPHQFEQLPKLIRNGAVFFHGVKTPECFKVIMEANRDRELAEEVRKSGGTVMWKD
jgi:hypothetical protein